MRDSAFKEAQAAEGTCRIRTLQVLASFDAITVYSAYLYFSQIAAGRGLLLWHSKSTIALRLRFCMEVLVSVEQREPMRLIQVRLRFPLQTFSANPRLADTVG